MPKVPKFTEILKKFTFAILLLYVVTVPVSSSYLGVDESPLFQKVINALTLLTTGCILSCVFVQGYRNPDSIKTEPYLIVTATLYLSMCLGSAMFAEHDIEHCLGRVVTLFCFLNNAFWPHVLFPKRKHLNYLTGGIIISTLGLALVYSYMAFLNNFSFNRYDYNNVGAVLGLPEELGLAFDPNIMLFGFMYGLICIFSYYSSEKLPKQRVVRLGIFGLAALMLGLLSLMFSRTTAIALTVTIAIYLIRRYYRDYRMWLVVAVVMFLAIVSLPELSAFVNKSEIYTNITEGREISNEDRLFRLVYSYELWLSNLKSIIIGRGYGIEILEFDPHNIYLTHLYSNGVVGFMAFAAFIVAIKLYGRGLTARENGVINLSLLYIAIGAATYWHNKSMWVIFLLCLMRTKVYRTAHQIPAVTYDFEEKPLTQLTRFGQSMGQKVTQLLAGKKSRRQQPKKARAPEWATKAAEKKTAFDFEETNAVTRMRKRLTSMVTGLQSTKTTRDRNSVTASKKMQQMSDPTSKSARKKAKK
jgi:O-antigen ligase